MELDICFPGFCSLGQKSGFPGSSAGKEYTCNARDPALILGSGRSPGGGIGYPLQYSWASLVVQSIKNLPAMRDTWVQSLGREDLRGEGNGNPLQHCYLENPMDRGAWWATVHGVAITACPIHTQRRGRGQGGRGGLSNQRFPLLDYEVTQGKAGI